MTQRGFSQKTTLFTILAMTGLFEALIFSAEVAMTLGDDADDGLWLFSPEIIILFSIVDERTTQPEFNSIVTAAHTTD